MPPAIVERLGDNRLPTARDEVRTLPAGSIAANVASRPVSDQKKPRLTLLNQSSAYAPLRPDTVLLGKEELERIGMGV